MIISVKKLRNMYKHTIMDEWDEKCRNFCNAGGWISTSPKLTPGDFKNFIEDVMQYNFEETEGLTSDIKKELPYITNVIEEFYYGESEKILKALNDFEDNNEVRGDYWYHCSYDRFYKYGYVIEAALIISAGKYFANNWYWNRELSMDELKRYIKI